MFEDIDVIYMSAKILRFWGLLYESNWRRYLCLSVTTFLVFTEMVYFFQSTEGTDALIRNSYMLVLWCDTILRGYVLVYNHGEYEKLLADLQDYFYELRVSEC